MPSLAALRIPRYRRLLAAYTFNAAGDWLGEIALSVVVFQATHSVLAVSALWVLARFAPAFFAPYTLSRLAHGGPARLYAAQALLYAGLTAAVAVGVPVAALGPVAFIDGVLALNARALVKTGIVAATRPAGLLREGNALLAFAFMLTLTLGPVAGGVLVAGAGAAAALALDALSFALAAACLRRVDVPSLETDAATPARTALRHVRGSAFLRRILSAEAAMTVLLAAVIPVELVFVTDTLGASTRAFGIVLAAWGLGAVAGSAVTALLPRLDTAALVAIGVTLMSAGYLGMGAAATVAPVIAFSFTGGIGNGLEGIAVGTLIQERTPEKLQAQVNGLVESLHSAAPGAGYVLGGAVAAAATPRATYWVAGVGAMVVLGLGACFIPGLLRTPDPRRPVVPEPG